MSSDPEGEAAKYPLFWGPFLKEAVQLREYALSGNVALVSSRVDQLLTLARLRFAYEVTIKPPDTAVLMLSPESNPTLAQAIDEFVKAAPVLSGWIVYPRRQRCDWQVAFQIIQRLYSVDAGDATFDVTPTTDGRYDIVMYSSVSDLFEEEVAEGLVSLFLECALGEDVVMRSVRQKSLAPPKDSNTSLSPEALVEKMSHCF